MQTNRWTILPGNAEEVASLRQALGVNETVCRILTQRGIKTFEEAKAFFRPQLDHLHSPWLMKDMDKAVDRLSIAIDSGERILVFGDYDVDGTTAVACVFDFLRDLTTPGQVDFYIPHRYREGYGVSKAGIDHAATENRTLIVCLDCGIKSTSLIAYAKTLGIDFIVCDHHLPGEELPEAVAILNAKQPGCPYPYKELCGCGVGFKLMTAMTERRNLPAEKLWEYLDLVSTAIAADIVPITGENRVMAFFGVERINAQPRPGLAALIELGGLKKKKLSINNVVFVIAPRINAAGRMDDARKAVDLFIEKDQENAFLIAEMLHADNTDRKDADSTITAHALQILESPEYKDRVTTVVYSEEWHKGVVGIVASRLIEHHYKPTVVLTRHGDLATGSARSIVGFNLYEAIYACREHLTTYGGHFAAAGLSMRIENLEAFIQQFETVVSSTIDPHLLQRELIIDAPITVKEIRSSLYNMIMQMEPFGPGNLRPVFIASGVRDTGFSKIVKEQHVRFVVEQEGATITGIGFNMADKFHLLQSSPLVDLAFTIDENEWNGITSMQLKVIDIRIHEPLATAG